jgi:hypothetical protein
VSGGCQYADTECTAETSKLTSHVCEFLAAALKVVAVLGLDGVLDGTRNRVVGAENGALDKLDLTGQTTLEATGSCGGTAGLLTLSPGFSRAGLAPLVWRGCPVRCAEITAGVVGGGCRVDVGPIVGLARVLCWAVCGVRLGQTVGRVGTVVGPAVEGVLGASCVLVEQRAADFILVVPATVILGADCQHTSGVVSKHRGQAHTSVLGSP